jgi:hypothetical protein
MHANPDGQRHLSHARSSGHRVPPAPSRRDLKPRKETMSGTWRSPALKPKSATRSGQRTTTSTPSIILGRYSRTEKERKTLCCDCRRLFAVTAARSGNQISRPRQPPNPADPVAVAVLAPVSSANFKRASLSTSIEIRRSLPAFGRGFWSSYLRKSALGSLRCSDAPLI